MANFYAYEFIFDGIPSHKFDLKITDFNDSSIYNGIGSSDVEILTQAVLRKSKPYYLGRTQHTVLEFSLTFGRAQPITGMDRDLISRWLFGREGYKKLEILQDDLNGAYFNCFLTKPEPIYIGNVNYGFTCTAVCDSPWAYGYEKYVTGNVESSASALVSVYNNSSEDSYLEPSITINTSWNSSASSVDFSIVNTSDNNREFLFTGLLPFTNVTVDNYLQIIDATVGETPVSTNVLSKFNMNWLKFIPKRNDLIIRAYHPTDQPTIGYSISYRERIKIGG